MRLELRGGDRGKVWSDRKIPGGEGAGKKMARQ